MGKSLLGPVTDLIGGDATMQITMAIITVLMYACAVSTSIQVILFVTLLPFVDQCKPLADFVVLNCGWCLPQILWTIFLSAISHSICFLHPLSLHSFLRLSVFTGSLLISFTHLPGGLVRWNASCQLYDDCTVSLYCLPINVHVFILILCNRISYFMCFVYVCVSCLCLCLLIRLCAYVCVLMCLCEHLISSNRHPNSHLNSIHITESNVH